MKTRNIMLRVTALSLLLGGCSSSESHHRKKGREKGLEINLLSGKSSSSSSAGTGSSSQKDDNTVKTEPMGDADTAALTTARCIAWGTAAYAVSHHLSFADTTDHSAKVTNEDGYGYIAMFKGGKQVARYRITAKGQLKGMKTKKIVSRKPIQIVLIKSSHKKHHSNITVFSKNSSSDSSSAGSSSKNAFDIGGKVNGVNEDTPFSSRHPTSQEQLVIWLSQHSITKGQCLLLRKRSGNQVRQIPESQSVTTETVGFSCAPIPAQTRTAM